MNRGHWGSSVECSIRSVTVIFIDGLFQLRAPGSEAVDQQVTPIIECFLEGPVSPLDAAMVGGFAGWQHLRDGPDFEGCLPDPFHQDASGGRGFGVPVYLGMDKV